MTTATTTPQILNLIGWKKTNNRAACAGTFWNNVWRSLPNDNVKFSYLRFWWQREPTAVNLSSLMKTIPPSQILNDVLKQPCWSKDYLCTQIYYFSEQTKGLLTLSWQSAFFRMWKVTWQNPANSLLTNTVAGDWRILKLRKRLLKAEHCQSLLWQSERKSLFFWLLNQNRSLFSSDVFVVVATVAA